MKIDLLEKIFTLSNADDLIVIIDNVAYANIRFANSSITSSGIVEETSFVFISIIDGKVGTVSADNLTTIEEIENALRKSEEIAAKNKKAEDYFPLVAVNEDAAKQTVSFSKCKVHIEENVIESMTGKILQVFESLSEYNNSGFSELKRYSILVANSKGLRKTYSGDYSFIGVTSKTEDFKKSVWHGANASSLTDIDINALISLQQKDFVYGENQLNMPAGRYDVILSPSCVADFLIYMFYMASLRDANEGRSVFAKAEDLKPAGSRIGEKLFPDFINIYSDPFAKLNHTLPFVLSSSSSSFSSVFDNGLHTERINWVKNGTLQNLITTREYAKKNDTKVAPFPYNFVMEGSDKKLDDLIKDVKKGLFVNTLWYIREVDPATGLLTGLTRDGVYVIEDGKIIGSCNNFRFNESPVELLKNTIDLSEPHLTLPREFDEADEVYVLPYLRVKDFNMSSVSDAV